MNNKKTSVIKLFGTLLMALLWTATSRLPAQEAPSVKNADGIKVLRRFEPVPGFGIKMANVVRLDQGTFKFETVSAITLAGKNRISVLQAVVAAGEPAVMMNASFFDLASGHPIGDFVEKGARPNNVITVPGKFFDRIFVVYKNGSADVLSGTEWLSEEQLSQVEYAVAGRSKWPGHSDLTNRSAVCIDKSGGVLLAVVYPVRTLEKMYDYMASEGCQPEKTVSLDGGGSTQMSFSVGNERWTLGWERKGKNVPECHLKGGSTSKVCYRPVANFIAAFPKP